MDVNVLCCKWDSCEESNNNTDFENWFHSKSLASLQITLSLGRLWFYWTYFWLLFRNYYLTVSVAFLVPLFVCLFIYPCVLYFVPSLCRIYTSYLLLSLSPIDNYSTLCNSLYLHIPTRFTLIPVSYTIYLTFSHLLTFTHLTSHSLTSLHSLHLTLTMYLSPIDLYFRLLLLP